MWAGHTPKNATHFFISNSAIMVWAHTLDVEIIFISLGLSHSAPCCKTGGVQARQMNCDAISLHASARQRGARHIPTAPYADISSDQRQLSPLRLNQRETLDRAHRWPELDKHRCTTLLGWLRIWLWPHTVYKIAHDGLSVVQNPSASSTQDTASLFSRKCEQALSKPFHMNHLSFKVENNPENFLGAELELNKFSSLFIIG